MVVEDENQLIFFSNGMVVNIVSNGVISFDSSGQVKNIITNFLSKRLMTLRIEKCYLHMILLRLKYLSGRKLQTQKLKIQEITF